MKKKKTQDIVLSNHSNQFKTHGEIQSSENGISCGCGSKIFRQPWMTAGEWQDAKIFFIQEHS